MTTWKLSEAEGHLLALQIIGLLNGLCAAEAQWVLKETETLIHNTHRVDTGNPLFTEYLEALRCASGQQAL